MVGDRINALIYPGVKRTRVLTNSIRMGTKLREVSSSYGFIQKTEHGDYIGSVLKVLYVSVLSYYRVRLITPDSALMRKLFVKKLGAERRGKGES